MSVSEISEIKLATNYTIESRNSSSAKEEIINLFAGKQFYNGGEYSKSNLEAEVNELQNYIDQKNSDYSQQYASLQAANKELNELNKKLEDEILEVTMQADKEEREQRTQIQNAISEVNQMYMSGDIDKEDMSSELYKKISKYSSLSSTVTSKAAKLSNTKLRISALTNRIASIIDSANIIESELNIANGTMSIMKNLMSKMSISGSVSKDDSASGALGFSINNKTYNFIIDKNSDNTVNDSSEFLGATNGFEELKELDANGDNVVCSEEMSSSNMFVLMTDNTSGTSKFMSLLESGVSSIDLSTITSEDFNELEEPQVKNIFTVNTVSGVSSQGLENISVNGYKQTEMLVSVDESVLEDAKNIFSQSASLSSNGLEDNIINAAVSIKSAQADVRKTSNEMSSNNRLASTKLTNQQRPETKEEKEAREAEEAEAKAKEEEKVQEEKEAKEKEIKEKEAAETKTKEEEKAKKEKEEKEKAEKEAK